VSVCAGGVFAFARVLSCLQAESRHDRPGVCKLIRHTKAAQVSKNLRCGYHRQMYQPHYVFRSPSNLNQKIWRYMDFTKFVAMLATRSLYFSRADQFNDPFEGSYTALTLQKERDEITQSLTSKGMENDQLMKVLKLLDELPLHRRWLRDNGAAMNCWHVNDHESAAMWSLYLTGREGIAIESTFARLCDSFHAYDHPVFTGLVNYINYDEDAFSRGNVLHAFIHKRKSFQHEEELRALITHTISVPDGSPSPPVESQNVEVDMNILIEKIAIAPTAPKWFFPVVEETLSKFGYSFPVRQSDLNKDPLF
jgi:hypothetical protein